MSKQFIKHPEITFISVDNNDNINPPEQDLRIGLLFKDSLGSVFDDIDLQASDLEIRIRPDSLNYTELIVEPSDIFSISMTEGTSDWIIYIKNVRYRTGRLEISLDKLTDRLGVMKIPTLHADFPVYGPDWINANTPSTFEILDKLDEIKESIKDLKPEYSTIEPPSSVEVETEEDEGIRYQLVREDQCGNVRSFHILHEWKCFNLKEMKELCRKQGPDKIRSNGATIEQRIKLIRDRGGCCAIKYPDYDNYDGKNKIWYYFRKINIRGFDIYNTAKWALECGNDN